MKNKNVKKLFNFHNLNSSESLEKLVKKLETSLER